MQALAEGCGVEDEAGFDDMDAKARDTVQSLGADMEAFEALWQQTHAKDERDFAAPIVSVSLGIPATFLFGGLRRKETPRRVALAHGDVVVWGGPARLRYHGVARVARAEHPFAGDCRINLTFRRAR